MKNFLRRAWLFLSFSMLLLFISCSPIKSSPHEQKHQTELTLQEMQTNIDDLRHDMQCFQTEFQILDGKIKHCEDTLNEVKQKFLSQIETSLYALKTKAQDLEKNLQDLSFSWEEKEKILKKLNQYAEESSLAFSQYKKKLQELESSQVNQEQKMEDLVSLKDTMEEIAKALDIKSSFHIHKVKPGESLEKIAKKYGVTIEALKKHNQLKKQDLIISGQKLKIPH